MKKKALNLKGAIFKFMIVLVIVILVAMLLTTKPVAGAVSKMTGWAADKIQNTARLVVGIAIAVALVTWGIAVLSIPVLGVGMIIAGLALLTYSVWPLFTSSKAAGAEASFNSKNPLSLVG